jgi:Flp pilus assembly protein CpaB
MASASGTKTGLIFILSIGFGIAAAVLSVLYLKSREAAIVASLAGEEDKMVGVVVAKQDLPKGQKINIGDFAVREVPSTYVHPNAISGTDFGNYVGRFLVEDISRGKPMLTSFIDETFPIDFSDLVKQGRRAITIQIDEPQSIAGMLRPGNHIDLYVNIATRVVGYETATAALAGLQNASLQQAAATAGNELLQTVAGARATEVIIPVMQDILVLATGREAYDDHLDALGQPQRRRGNTFTTVTLDVTPEQAAILSIAEDKGDLIGVLRNRNDRGAADFTGVTALDLLAHVQQMQKEAAMRAAAAAAGATIDENGNWVTADGKVIKKEDIVISENGTVTTRGGQLLAAEGIAVNENGEYVDANGNVIPPDELVFNADGSVTTKAEMMKAAGYTVNENGDYVDANGNVVRKEDIKVLANGTVMTADGKVLSGPKVTVNKDGFIIAEDGTVMTADGKVLSGVTVNEKGEVVAADGTVLKDANLTVAADGTVRDSNGNVIAGVTGSSLPPGFAEAAPAEIEIPDITGYVALIIGGKGKDGVALTNTMRVEPVAVKFPVPATQETETPGLPPQ